MNNGQYKDNVCFPKFIFSHVYDNKTKKNHKNVSSQLVQLYTTFYCIQHLIYITMHSIHCKSPYDIKVFKKFDII